MYPSHLRPVLTHFWHAGLCSSHLTRRILMNGQLYNARSRDVGFTNLQVIQPVTVLRVICWAPPTSSLFFSAIVRS